MPELRNVEILKVGNWKGENFTTDYLDNLIAAANEVDFKIPVKLGHDKSPSAPAVGWVDNLRRVGNVLVADFVDIPKSVFGMIKDKMFNQVSVEILANLNRVGKTFSKALGAVALLGASIPAVEGLKPLSASFSLEFESSTDVVSTLNLGEDAMDVNQVKALLEAAEKRLADLNKAQETKAAEVAALSATVDKLKADLEAERNSFTAKLTAMQQERSQDRIEAKVKSITIPALQEPVRGCYNIAMSLAEGQTVKVFSSETKAFEERWPESLVDDLVQALNTIAEKVFKEYSVTNEKPRTNESAADELDRKVKEYMANHKEVASYMEAQRLVLAADDGLKQRYAFEG